jgi:hypothetical protein
MVYLLPLSQEPVSGLYVSQMTPVTFSPSALYDIVYSYPLTDPYIFQVFFFFFFNIIIYLQHVPLQCNTTCSSLLLVTAVYSLLFVCFELYRVH